MDLVKAHDQLREAGWKDYQLARLDRLRSRAARQELEYTEEYKRLLFARYLRQVERISEGEVRPCAPTFEQIADALDIAGGASEQRPAYAGNAGSYPADEPDYGG